MVDAIEEQDPDQITQDGIEQTDIPILSAMALPKETKVPKDKYDRVRD